MNPHVISLLLTWLSLSGVLLAIGGVFWLMGFLADRC